MWHVINLRDKLWTTDLVSWTYVHGAGWYCLKNDLGPDFNIKMTSYQYRKSHCRDKTVERSSYLHNGNSFTGKTTSLYWIRALGGCWCCAGFTHTCEYEACCDIRWSLYSCLSVVKHVYKIMSLIDERKSRSMGERERAERKRRKGGWKDVR